MGSVLVGHHKYNLNYKGASSEECKVLSTAKFKSPLTWTNCKSHDFEQSSPMAFPTTIFNSFSTLSPPNNNRTVRDCSLFIRGEGGLGEKLKKSPFFYQDPPQ